MTIRALAVASEAYPYVKTGGLADVVGALPAALRRYEVETTTLIPGYPTAIGKLREKSRIFEFDQRLGFRGGLVADQANGLLLLDAPELFDRPGGPYADEAGREWPDNGRRFAALARVAAECALGRVPGVAVDLLHAHDWQAGLAPAYLAFAREKAPPSVLTIHNLAFQGRFSAEMFAELALPERAWSIDGVEYHGGVGFLKAGLQTASAITTVSPTYADEILTPQFGMGLEGLLQHRRTLLSGIVNGIDTSEWDPAADPHLAARYSAEKPGKRAKNKAAVEQAFGLESGPGPVFCVISRLTWQKGMDLLPSAIDDLVARGGRLALLGSGDRAIEAALHAAAARHPGKVGIRIGYDEPLSHLLQAGADAILIPSRFEPCGLTQLYGLRYGCVPVVARTGGLADTVIDANEAALASGVATGFQVASAEALSAGIARAIDVYDRPKVWATIQRNGMRADFSWDRSAARYAALYESLVARER